MNEYFHSLLCSNPDKTVREILNGEHIPGSIDPSFDNADYLKKIVKEIDSREITTKVSQIITSDFNKYINKINEKKFDISFGDLLYFRELIVAANYFLNECNIDNFEFEKIVEKKLGKYAQILLYAAELKCNKESTESNIIKMYKKWKELLKQDDPWFNKIAEKGIKNYNEKWEKCPQSEGKSIEDYLNRLYVERPDHSSKDYSNYLILFSLCLVVRKQQPLFYEMSNYPDQKKKDIFNQKVKNICQSKF